MGKPRGQKVDSLRASQRKGPREIGGPALAKREKWSEVRAWPSPRGKTRWLADRAFGSRFERLKTARFNKSGMGVSKIGDT